MEYDTALIAPHSPLPLSFAWISSDEFSIATLVDKKKLLTAFESAWTKFDS